MKVNRIEVFKESTKIKGSYDESKFRSILDENYDNFCNFCENLDNKYNVIDKIECVLCSENHEINFNIKSNGISEDFRYNY